MASQHTGIRPPAASASKSKSQLSTPPTANHPRPSGLPTAKKYPLAYENRNPSFRLEGGAASNAGNTSYF
jgi:hypothetical protein